MTYAINTCLMMTIVSVAALIMFTVQPNALIYVGILYLHSKLHFNSLLATLNSREALLEKLGEQVISDTARYGIQNENRPTKQLSNLRFEHAVVTTSQEADIDFEIKSHV